MAKSNFFIKLLVKKHGKNYEYSHLLDYFKELGIFYRVIYNPHTFSPNLEVYIHKKEKIISLYKDTNMLTFVQLADDENFWNKIMSHTEIKKIIVNYKMNNFL